MQQQDAQAADEFALLRPAHAVDFLGDVLDVGLGQFSRPEEFSLLSAPGVEIAIVERALRGHARRIGSPTGGVHRVLRRGRVNGQKATSPRSMFSKSKVNTGFESRLE